MKLTSLQIAPENEQFSNLRAAESATTLFAKLFSETNEKLIHADAELQTLAQGKTANLHEVMISMEDAKLSLQFLTQIRNRLITAYQDLIKEQL